METTPKKISGRVKSFLRKANLTEQPIYLTFTLVSKNYIGNFCHDNTKEETEKNGGSVVFGWTIWENKKTRFMEAEFHSVVKKHGEYLDITPRPDGESKILFVPDAAKKAEHQTSQWNTWTNIRAQKGYFEHTKPKLRPTRTSLGV